MPQIITVANEKGGVAKTTTAISMGGGLVQSSKSVLLIDLDPQASLSVYFGSALPDKVSSSADILINSTKPEPIKTNIPGLDFIPASRELSLADRFLSVRNNPTNILKSVLNQIQNFDTIILDCPPSLGIITQNALVAADILIIPVTPEYLAVNTLRTIFQLVRSIRSTQNPGLIYRILFTMVDMRIRSHGTISTRFREKFPSAVLNTQIHVDTRIRNASISGLPVTMFSPNTRSALEYRSLLQEISTDPSYPPPDTKSNMIF